MSNSTSGAGVGKGEQQLVEKLELIDGLFEDRIRLGQTLLEAAQKMNTQSERDYRLLMAFFYAKAFRDYQAAATLWMRGFGSESWAMGRSLIEIALQTALLRQDPKSNALAFFRHADVKRYDTLLKMKRLIDSNATVAPPEVKYDLAHPEMQRLRQEYEAHKSKFYQGKNSKRIWDNWWKGNLRELSERVRNDPEYGQYLFDEYHVSYRFGSSFVHSAEMILPEFVAKGKGGFHIIQPELGSEESAPMHLTRRLMLIGIFLNQLCALGYDQLLKDEWNAMDEAFKAGQEELTKKAL